MRHPHLILGIIVSALLLGPSAEAQLPDFPFVFAIGQAESELPPDIATVSFQVLAYNEDPSIALSIIHTRSGELLGLFKKKGISEADIVSYEIDKSARQRESERGETLELIAGLLTYTKILAVFG